MKGCISDNALQSIVGLNSIHFISITRVLARSLDYVIDHIIVIPHQQFWHSTLYNRCVMNSNLRFSTTWLAKPKRTQKIPPPSQNHCSHYTDDKPVYVLSALYHKNITFQKLHQNTLRCFFTDNLNTISSQNTWTPLLIKSWTKWTPHLINSSVTWKGRWKERWKESRKGAQERALSHLPCSIHFRCVMK